MRWFVWGLQKLNNLYNQVSIRKPGGIRNPSCFSEPHELITPHLPSAPILQTKSGGFFIDKKQYLLYDIKQKFNLTHNPEIPKRRLA